MSIQISEAYEYIKTRYHGDIDVAIILGSGLGSLADQIEYPTEIDFRDIPHFPTSNVVGHESKIIIGSLGNKTVLALKGRIHYYEGNSMEIVTLPVRVISKLGIKTIIITNASGGIADDLNPGDIAIIKDHISLYCPSPLRGDNLDDFGPRFVDMTNIYTPRLQNIAKTVAKVNNFDIKEGTYVFFPGPMYETPAEIQVFKTIGASMTGMSSVPEAIVARHCGMDILGLSLITNKAAGLSDANLNHSEVLDTASRVETDFVKLVESIIKQI